MSIFKYLFYEKFLEILAFKVEFRVEMLVAVYFC